MLSDEEAKQLVEDARKMAREWSKIIRTDKDPARRQQAKRWWATILRILEYSKQVRDMYRRGRRGKLFRDS
jgi:hypothetical protein